MKPKLLFWIDRAMVHFFLAKSIQDNLDCEMYSIFEVTNKPKIFFQNEKLIKFKKIWFYYDYILKTKRKPDLNYLKSIEEKYNIPLWLIAANDRFFMDCYTCHNKFYKFSYDEILLILEDEIKLYEMILDEVKPDFVLMLISHQQHNHIFYKICKSRGIKIIMPIPSRFNIYEKKSMHTGLSERIFLGDQLDQCLPLPKTKNLKNDNKPSIPQQNNSISDKKFSHNASTAHKESASNYVKAAIKYLFTTDKNIKTHYTYFGRSKIKVIFKILFYELRKKHRENFMGKNLELKIDEKSDFIFFPMHQEMERILLIGAPFYINQFEVMQNIAKSLPIGYKLCVKDHMVMNVRGWRSVNEMKKIMNLHNVILLHPSANSNELIKKSKLVITIKGSSIIEAAFHNKPIICFENVGMFKISSQTLLKSIKDLPETIRNSLKQKVDKNEIEIYKKAVYDNTFEFRYAEIQKVIDDVLNMGGYYANTEIRSEKISSLLEKFKAELTFFALKHIEKMKELS